MKKCYKCGTSWEGYGQPRSRQICEGCGAYLHSCVNCHHFDHDGTSSCRLSKTAYIGPRDALNYCDEFRMTNFHLRAVETRKARAKDVWEELFRK